MSSLCPQGAAACGNNPNRVVVAAARKTKANCPACPNTTSSSTYGKWGYDVRADGSIATSGSAPTPP